MILTKHGKTEDGKSYFFEASVSGEDFEKAIEHAYKQNVKKIKIDGFRDGKAPRSIIEKTHGADFFYDYALDKLLPDCYRDCMNEVEIAVIDRPSADIKSIDKEKGVEVRFEVLLRPELTIKKYKGLTAKKDKVKIGDEDVEKELKDVQFKQSRLEAVENRASQADDTVCFDFEGFVDGVAFDGGKAEKYTITIGSNQFIPGFEDQLIGHNIGEDFDVNVKFPEDYNAEHLAGKDATFKCKLHEIRVRELPEINDELAKDADFDTLDDMKADILKRLTEHAEEHAEHDFENELNDKLIENLEGDIPEIMVENRIDEMVNDFDYRLANQGLKLDDYLKYMGADMPAFRAQYKEQAEKSVKLRLALEAVARAESLSVSDDEVEKELEGMKEEYKMDIEKIKSLVDIAEIKAYLLNKKAFEAVKSSAKVTSK